jgi:hypothetical protein
VVLAKARRSLGFVLGWTPGLLVACLFLQT